MRAVDVISHKRDGYELSREEIIFFINGFTSAEITDYKASAWAIAALLIGRFPRETSTLTQAFLSS